MRGRERLLAAVRKRAVLLVCPWTGRTVSVEPRLSRGGQAVLTSYQIDRAMAELEHGRGGVTAVDAAGRLFVEEEA